MDNIRKYETQGEKFTTDYDVITNRLYSAYNHNKNDAQARLIHSSVDDSVVHIKDYYDIVWCKFINKTGISSSNDPYPPMRNYFNNYPELFSNIGKGLWCTKEFAKLNGYNDIRPRINNAPNEQGLMDIFIKQKNELFEQGINEERRLSDSYDDATSKIKDNRYSKNAFLNEVYTDEEHYNNLVALLRNKKNIILQGAPGVGKTYAAMRLAWSMMGEKDNDRIEFIQFHQNYSYEDFIMGYKPVNEGFKIKKGIFYRFCKKAEKSPDKEFFFIIDEINRGNMSKIFGELLMLIEKDYRGMEITLAYRNERFSVPNNLYIIGMMNTADRSLAMIDYALRRRFSFFEMEPGFDSKNFIQYLDGLKNDTINKIISVIRELNKEIPKDKSLGKGFCIGHSYFCNLRQNDIEDRLHSIVDYDILPMLSEYWFDDDDKYSLWRKQLEDVFKR